MPWAVESSAPAFTPVPCVSQESSQGSVLLDGLAAAATDAAKASSEAYAAAAGGVAAQEGPQTAEAAQQETQEAWAGLEQRAQ